MRKSRTLDGDYFEGLYRANVDPWGFETSAYEREKYARTLEVLGAGRTASALEVGCSIGVLTHQLADRCERLTATDISTTALELAKSRCVDRPNVDFRLVSSAAQSFEGAFDLMVLSEVVYYWDDGDLDAAAQAIGRSIQPGGRLLLVHWLGETDYPKTAEDAVEGLAAHLHGRLDVEIAEQSADYRLDLWRWTSAI